MGVRDHKVTADIIRSMKGVRPIAALTAYDFAMAKLLDQAEIPFILVGDSLGMVVLGYPDTSLVTMQDMEHHVRAAARAQPRALLAADLPFQSCSTPENARRNAQRLVAAGAEAVKAEGVQTMLPAIEAILSAGIPFCGHIGMLPQKFREEGRYSIKGKLESERQQLIHDAIALERAGAFALVLELVTPPVAAEITARLSIPTIGIGSGPDCDGQILVTSDLWGTSPGFIPKHVKLRKDLKNEMLSAVAEWRDNLPSKK